MGSRERDFGAADGPGKNPDDGGKPGTYDTWYCEKYPTANIRNPEDTKLFPWRDALRPVLADNIAEHGLLNPLIVLNHRNKRKYKDPWILTGLNRLNAVRRLGWETVPCIVTGECPYDKIAVHPEELHHYFRDGSVSYEYGWPMLVGACKFRQGEWPDMEGRSPPYGVGLA